MDYKGNLYGYIGTGFFFTGKTADDWDKMEAELKELRERVKTISEMENEPAFSKAVCETSEFCRHQDEDGMCTSPYCCQHKKLTELMDR